MRGRHGGSPVPPAAGFPQERTAPNMPTHPTLPTRQKGTLSRGNSGPPSQKATPSESRCQRAFGRRQPDAISRTTRCLSPPPPPPVSAGREACRVGVGRARGAPPPPRWVLEAHSKGPPHNPARCGGRQAGRREGRNPARGRQAAGGTASPQSLHPLRHPLACRPSSTPLGCLDLLSQALSVVHPGREGGDPAFSPSLALR